MEFRATYAALSDGAAHCVSDCCVLDSVKLPPGSEWGATLPLPRVQLGRWSKLLSMLTDTRFTFIMLSYFWIQKWACVRFYGIWYLLGPLESEAVWLASLGSLLLCRTEAMLHRHNTGDTNSASPIVVCNLHDNKNMTEAGSPTERSEVPVDAANLHGPACCNE